MLGRKFELTLHQWLQSGPLDNWKNKIFSVGGFVRDSLLGRDSNDIDLMITVAGGSEKLSHEFKIIFQGEITNPLQMGSLYPIWSFEFRSGEFKGLKIDLADSQKEMFPKNDERQRVASFGTFDEDIQRRDFTVNMLVRDLTTDQVVDQSGVGLQDLEAKMIRAHPLVDARKILSDDPLRMIRAVRFACTHDFHIDDSLFVKIREQSQRIKIVSAERILQEIKKISMSDQFGSALEMFADLDMIDLIFTEPIKKIVNDVKLRTVLLRIFRASKKQLEFQLAGLFYFLSSTEVEDIFIKLKLSHQQKRDVQSIIGLTEKLLLLSPQNFLEIRPFVRAVSLNIIDLVDFASGVSEDFKKTDFLITLKRCQTIPVSKKPLLNGHEIADLLKISGPEIKKAQDMLFLIEDKYVMDFSESMPVEDAKVELLKRFKSIENQ